MIVRITVASMPVSAGGLFISPGTVAIAPGGDCVSPGGGGGSATPTVGMLPAKIEVDSAHMSTTAIASLFI
jgi:hypothetical protein